MAYAEREITLCLASSADSPRVPSSGTSLA